uniref:Uncharacterized protein n=1 Tax=Salix viminalis TaxID=40686 RepID=A0A6N2M6J0_SALVM
MARTKQTLEHTGDLQIQDLINVSTVLRNEPLRNWKACPDWENGAWNKDGAGAYGTSRKKSSAPSANQRVKSCQSESASSSAKSISESSDSEIGPWQDASFTSY